MFERYTEKARRVIFFARYEASMLGSPLIEPEHVLIGILREDKVLTNRFLPRHTDVEWIRKQIEKKAANRERTQTAVDLPLSEEGKQVLRDAAEEADNLSSKSIGPHHLLVGILRREDYFAATLLANRGVTLKAVREQLVLQPHQERAQPPPEMAVLKKFCRDLIQAAGDQKTNPVVARDQEIEWVIEVLCSRNNKNPLLVGEDGSGKTAVVEAVAQRIADGEVPPSLMGKHVLAFDAQLMLRRNRDRQGLEEELNEIIQALTVSPGTIVFIDDLHTFLGFANSSGSISAAEILRPVLLSGSIQCIGTCTPNDYRRLRAVAPWLERCFRTVKVFPLDEAKTLLALQCHKNQYETFHEVSYTDDAVRYAAHYARRCFPDSPILAKAIEILDAAGARVTLRRTSLPDEVVEVQKRIRFIVHRMESCITSHEFEKARFYSDEERKEREHLHHLRTKYQLEDSEVKRVDRQNIEDVVSRWTGISVASIQQYAPPPTSPAGAAPRTPDPATADNLPLRVFLCHSSKDKPTVRELYRKLGQCQMTVWLDEVNLLPGQDWEFEISNAVRSSHVVIVCLSTQSVTKAGFVHREMKKALDVADEQPEGTIYVIPVKLDECEVPSRLKRWHWVNLFEPKGFEKLIDALHVRASSLAQSSEDTAIEE